MTDNIPMQELRKRVHNKESTSTSKSGTSQPKGTKELKNATTLDGNKNDKKTDRKESSSGVFMRGSSAIYCSEYCMDNEYLNSIDLDLSKKSK